MNIKLRFKVVESNENQKFFIDNKEVSKKVFDSIWSDDSLFIDMPQSKQNSSCDNMIDFSNDDLEDFNYDESLLEVLNVLKESDDKTALDLLINNINFNCNMSYMEGQLDLMKQLQIGGSNIYHDIYKEYSNYLIENEIDEDN